jgi:hypothetical protein
MDFANHLLFRNSSTGIHLQRRPVRRDDGTARLQTTAIHVECLGHKRSDTPSHALTKTSNVPRLSARSPANAPGSSNLIWVGRGLWPRHASGSVLVAELEEGDVVQVTG